MLDALHVCLGHAFHAASLLLCACATCSRRLLLLARRTLAQLVLWRLFELFPTLPARDATAAALLRFFRRGRAGLHAAPFQPPCAGGMPCFESSPPTFATSAHTPLWHTPAPALLPCPALLPAKQGERGCEPAAPRPLPRLQLRCIPAGRGRHAGRRAVPRGRRAARRGRVRGRPAGSWVHLRCLRGLGYLPAGGAHAAGHPVHQRPLPPCLFSRCWR